MLRGHQARQARTTAIGALAAAALLAFLLAPTAALAAPCANEAIREGQASSALPAGSAYLPGCMALEMVSPSVKSQQSAVNATFSADGERVKFRSAAALAATPGVQGVLDSYVATRGTSGWAAAATSPPASAEIAGGTGVKGAPYGFAADLSRWNLLGATSPQLQVGAGQVFQGGLDGYFFPLSPELVAIDNSGTTTVIQLNFDLTGAESTGSSADLSTTVFHLALASSALLPGDPLPPPSTGAGSEPGNDLNNYVASRGAGGEPTLQLLARDKDGRVYGGRCGTHLGGGLATEGAFNGAINQGAISRDGARIYFSTRPAQPWNQETHEGPACSTANPLRIFKRTETAEGPLIAPLIEGEEEAKWSEAGSDLYQGASVSGTRVYFTSSRKLSSADKDTSAEECDAELGASAGCDLYLYDSTKAPANRITDVSAGAAGDPTPGKGADVLSSITAVSGDGSRVYFVAQGKLTSAQNPEGAEATIGQPNLYSYDAAAGGSLAFIGTLAATDEARLWGTERSFVRGAYAVPSIGPGEGTGGDGHILLFASRAPLTPDDTDGGYADVYRYDAQAGTLQRVSKAAPGGSETPPADAEVNPNRASPNANPFEEGRWASEDGETVAFATAEPLAPGDEDGAANPYVWKEGTLARLPSGFVAGEARPTVSPAGNEVGFTTQEQLLPGDRDTAPDVYVARADGGYAPAVEPSACDPLAEGSCRTAEAAPALALPAPFTGPGNVKPAKKCRRGFVRRHGHCARKRHHQKRHQKHNKQGKGKGR